MLIGLQEMARGEVVLVLVAAVAGVGDVRARGVEEERRVLGNSRWTPMVPVVFSRESACTWLGISLEIQTVYTEKPTQLLFIM